MALWRGRPKSAVLSAEHDVAGSTNGTTGASDQHSGRQVVDELREWLFPGSDEYYRTLHTRVIQERPEVLVITSATSGEGKTTTALGLAITVAQDFPGRACCCSRPIWTTLSSPMTSASNRAQVSGLPHRGSACHQSLSTDVR